MNQALKKFVSVFCLVIFLLGSGTGQLLHAAFHKHEFVNTRQTTTAVSLPHTYCTALQLMLPEFSGSSIIDVPVKPTEQFFSFPQIEINIPLFYSFKTSDRAPPVLVS